MHLFDFHFSELTENDKFESFDCGEIEIDKFLKEDSINFQNEKMTNTFIFKNNEDKVVIYFSISNDCLNDVRYENNVWNKLHRKIKLPNEKRIRQYPSVKITQLGIDKSIQGKGLSHQLLDFIKYWTFEQHKPACRLIILDSLNKELQISTYLKNDFVFLSDLDKDSKHRFMYFDLLRLE